MNCCSDCGGSQVTFKVETDRTKKVICDKCVRPYLFSTMWTVSYFGWEKERPRPVIKPKKKEKA